VRVVVVPLSLRRGLGPRFDDVTRFTKRLFSAPEEALFSFGAMPTRLCVTVTAATMAELRQRRDEITNADLVELRLDTVRDASVAGALSGRGLPVIVTCRPRWEGGGFDGSEEERHRILLDAQRLGAEYVDVEWKAGFHDLVAAGRGVVLSHHDFRGIPDDLDGRAAAMRATGAEVIKIAAMAHELADCVHLLALARQQASVGPTVVLAMGEAGVTSRILAARFGSCWTYAGSAAAPGQLPASRLLDEFGFADLTATTALYGVVGKPIAHSVSPAMHNAAFRAAAIDAVYVPLAAATFSDFLTFADGLMVQGASVTAPFKLDALSHATLCDHEGQQVGAVNTLRREDGGWAAINTDISAVVAPLQRLTDLHGRRVTVLGAGGAARAAVQALRGAGAHVSIAARDRERAEAAGRMAGAATTTWPPPAGSWDVLINATPIGTSPHVADTPLPGGPFTGQIVYDLVYNPQETRLLREASAAGCRTIGGLDMLVAQAERQFEWWTRRHAPEHVMRQAALRALEQV
jgi:3-dehydroquinate dehydratase / shikimate dehydrogenase